MAELKGANVNEPKKDKKADGYARLAMAVIDRAVDDWRNNKAEIKRCTARMHECENFFKSDWYQDLNYVAGGVCPQNMIPYLDKPEPEVVELEPKTKAKYKNKKVGDTKPLPQKFSYSKHQDLEGQLAKFRFEWQKYLEAKMKSVGVEVEWQKDDGFLYHVADLKLKKDGKDLNYEYSLYDGILSARFANDIVYYGKFSVEELTGLFTKEEEQNE